MLVNTLFTEVVPCRGAPCEVSALISLRATFAASTSACILVANDFSSLATETVTLVAGALTVNVTPGMTPVNVLLWLLTV